MRVWIILCSFLLCTTSVALAVQPSESKQTLVMGNEKEKVYLYATPNEKEDLYTDFHVKIGNQVVETQGWEVSMSETRLPELHIVDLNHDGKKEIVVIITIGTGTWVVMKQAHILQEVETSVGRAYAEMDIDNPVHTIERDFTITATNKMIKVKGRGHEWKAANACGKTYYHHRFPLYQYVNWRVEGNKLMADVGLTITHNCVPAGFLLTYEQKGEIYIAKKIKVNL
ncbi:hypothetical protein V7128_17585 [Neobacillus vireti]|uniref:hypothetical protein n=1 Tax=Neobacillus vireti TaxID=220686 RepID=UPI002FFE4B97